VKGGIGCSEGTPRGLEEHEALVRLRMEKKKKERESNIYGAGG
jgi:hypothetical protein